MDNDKTGTGQSSFGPGMEEQHQDLGGAPGGVRGMASKAGEKLMDTAEHQKMAGADFMHGIADAVRRAAGEFEGQSPQAAEYIRYAADRMGWMSESIRRRDLGQMLSDVQDFARRQPTAFLGVSFLAGFAAVRFLRSSTSQGGSASATWSDRSPMDDGRYGQGLGGGSGLSPGMTDRPGAASSPGSVSPGMNPGSGV